MMPPSGPIDVDWLVGPPAKGFPLLIPVVQKFVCTKIFQPLVGSDPPKRGLIEVEIGFGCSYTLRLPSKRFRRYAPGLKILCRVVER